MLVDLEGYPVQEAAEILEVPVGTVKSRCSRGRARLAVLLADLARSPGTGPGPLRPISRTPDKAPDKAPAKARPKHPAIHPNAATRTTRR